MTREEILEYLLEGCRMLQEEVSTEELTDYAREQSWYHISNAIEYIRENEDMVF